MAELDAALKITVWLGRGGGGGSPFWPRGTKKESHLKHGQGLRKQIKVSMAEELERFTSGISRKKTISKCSFADDLVSVSQKMTPTKPHRTFSTQSNLVTTDLEGHDESVRYNARSSSPCPIKRAVDSVDRLNLVMSNPRICCSVKALIHH